MARLVVVERATILKDKGKGKHGMGGAQAAAAA